MKISRIGYITSLPSETYEKVLTKPHYLLGVYYDGKIEKAILEFVDERGEKLVKMIDPTRHKTYFLTLDDPESIKERIENLERAGIDSLEEVYKINPLTMEKTRFIKVVTRDPLVVRKIRSKFNTAWEAKIKYHANYIYDNQLIPGMRYVVEVSNGFQKLVMVKPEVPATLVEKVRELFKNEPRETVSLAEELLLIFEEAPPRVKRVAVDIEVFTPFKGRVPSPKLAEYPVISVALVGNDGFSKILLLARDYKHDFDYMMENYPSNAEIEVFDSEREMILEVFRIIGQYPVVLTYNGDNFDLQYLYMRAIKLGIPRVNIPLKIGEDMVRIDTSIHLDLYKFFSNRAVKNYAFGGKYQEEKLDAVSSALLGVSKIGFEETIGDISASLLIAYNYRDAEITLNLTLFSNELVWKLMILLARVSKTSIEDICRRQISNWIQNLFFWEHRSLGFLIPNKEDILKHVRSTSTKAIIEGKKYAGALVVEPPKGAFFNVVVLDIASLYPSIIKRYNLSYETVDMKWCKKTIDIVDETGRKLHEVCVDKPGLTAQLTGILRDFRVGIYKKRSKDKNLPPELLAWYEVVQRAIKVFINASYGVFGDEKFSLYSPAVAESVTAMGRKSFYTIVRKAADLGVKTLYGDTDSIFVWAPTQDQLKRLQTWILDRLGLEIEIDKVFTYVVFTGLKKNYLGRTVDGGIEIKGLVAKKRNTPEFLKDLFEDILERLKSVENPHDFVEFVEWLERQVKTIHHDIKRREITLDRLAIRVALTKTPSLYTKTKPPHVKAALQLMNYGYSVEEGDIITFVKVKSKEGYKAIQLTKLQEVDPDKYIDLVKSGLEQFLSAFGIKWEDIIGSGGLGDLLRSR
ncbi:MAG: DNA-directed DNA polymerase I [Thermosphaera sp.]